MNKKEQQNFLFAALFSKNRPYFCRLMTSFCPALCANVKRWIVRYNQNWLSDQRIFRSLINDTGGNSQLMNYDMKKEILFFSVVSYFSYGFSFLGISFFFAGGHSFDECYIASTRVQNWTCLCQLGLAISWGSITQRSSCFICVFVFKQN